MRACRCVPLYDTFGPDAVRFIIQHSGAKVLFCSADKLETLCEVLPHVKDQVGQVVVWQGMSGESAEAAVQMVRRPWLASPCLHLSAATVWHSTAVVARAFGKAFMRCEGQLRCACTVSGRSHLAWHSARPADASMQACGFSSPTMN